MSFRRMSEVGGSFDALEECIPQQELQLAYCNRWKRRYAEVLRDADGTGVIAWRIRCVRAYKSSFIAASFYTESLQLKARRSWSAYYFLQYYALWHGMLAANCFVPEETTEALGKEMTHSKNQKVFFSAFCNPKPAIVTPHIYQTYDVLKYAREYYSYTMPMNDFVGSLPGLPEAEASLPRLLRSCLQLVSLHSFMLCSSLKKRSSRGSVNPVAEHAKVDELFSLLNAQQHPIDHRYYLDPSDQYRRAEVVSGVVGSDPFVIEFEHWVDEFRTYCALPNADSSQAVVSFVWNAIQGP